MAVYFQTGKAFLTTEHSAYFAETRYVSFIAIQPENTGMKFGPHLSALVLMQLDYDVPGTTTTRRYQIGNLA